MIDWNNIFLTAIITTFLGILVWLFIRYFLEPYFKFKDKIIEIEAHLNFGEYILISSWNEEEIGKNSFIDYILEIQRGMRKDIADLKTFYKHIPSFRISMANLPNKMEMKEVESKFNSLANSQILFLSKNAPKNQDEQIEQRKEYIRNIKEFIEKYTKF